MPAPPGNGVTQRKKPEVLSNQQSADRKKKDEQKLKELQNTFIYRKIDGIDVKCRQLIAVNRKVFAATNNGLYLINGQSATNLTPGVYVNHVTPSNNGADLLLATLSGVIRLSYTGKDWVAKNLADSISFTAYNVIEDENGAVWAGTDNGAFIYTPNGIRFHRIPDVLNERVLVSNIYGKIHFLLPNAIFHYVPDSDTILPANLPEVPTSGRLDYHLGDNGIIWIKSGFGWHVLNGDQFLPMLPYLDLFSDIRNLSTDKDGNIYVIDKGTDLYSVLNRTKENVAKFNIYIRKILDGSGQPFSLQQMKIESDGGSLVFNVSAPFYLKNKGTEYQYRIEGHRDNWSRWDDDPLIDPGKFSPGDYVLQVRARNILGEISEIKTLSFSVPAPLLLRWYFLLAYVLILSLAIFGLIKFRERSLKETQRILEDKVAQRTADLAKAKEQAEELLLNILPRETAEELQIHGKATARHYNQVSVLFTDFKGFTAFAENTKPEDLVRELHRCFVRFDEIIGKYHLEKIKTIGDAYMCAGGVPIRNNSNAIAMTLAALEIRDFMDQVVEQKKKNNEDILEIRIGIHTGPLTAGVVGMKKFAYDIWGDTVNTASRMETASEPGKVNVSGTTHELIKKYFECEFRGKREVKGKGMVEMYFVHSIKPEFSEKGEGKAPNKDLLELVN
jgi:class 3 adenylate cyclase